jgi:hypothetical protein
MLVQISVEMQKQGVCAMDAVDFQVSPPIEGVDQGNSQLCWLAATAVLFQWRDGVPVSLQDAANTLGAYFIAKYANLAPLDYGDMQQWQQAGGFESQGQQCFDADGWSSLLQQYGPLITLISGNATDTINHAVVVGGVSGDGTTAGTSLTVADGNGGTVSAVDLGTFTTLFEVTGGTNQLFSVMYFPT